MLLGIWPVFYWIVRRSLYRWAAGKPRLLSSLVVKCKELQYSVLKVKKWRHGLYRSVRFIRPEWHGVGSLSKTNIGIFKQRRNIHALTAEVDSVCSKYKRSPRILESLAYRLQSGFFSYTRNWTGLYVLLQFFTRRAQDMRGPSQFEAEFNLSHGSKEDVIKFKWWLVV